jgi:hypothetical protein
MAKAAAGCLQGAIIPRTLGCQSTAADDSKVQLPEAPRDCLSAPCPSCVRPSSCTHSAALLTRQTPQLSATARIWPTSHERPLEQDSEHRAANVAVQRVVRTDVIGDVEWIAELCQ